MTKLSTSVDMIEELREENARLRKEIKLFLSAMNEYRCPPTIDISWDYCNKTLCSTCWKRWIDKQIEKGQ
jgi:hypothetical protein